MLSTLAVLLGLGSCTMHNKSIAGAHLDARVIFQSSDLEYVGEVNGVAVQHYFLGLPYGGRKWHYANTGGSFINTATRTFDRSYNNALYDALSQKPDADFVLPISTESTTDMGFLGRKVTLKVKAKAFKIRTK